MTAKQPCLYHNNTIYIDINVCVFVCVQPMQGSCFGVLSFVKMISNDISIQIT